MCMRTCVEMQPLPTLQPTAPWCPSWRARSTWELLSTLSVARKSSRWDLRLYTSSSTQGRHQLCLAVPNLSSTRSLIWGPRRLQPECTLDTELQNGASNCKSQAIWAISSSHPVLQLLAANTVYQIAEAIHEPVWESCSCWEKKTTQRTIWNSSQHWPPWWPGWTASTCRWFPQRMTSVRVSIAMKN